MITSPSLRQRRTIAGVVTLAVLSAGSAVAAGSGAHAAVATSWRGDIVWAQHQRSLTAAQTRITLHASEFDAVQVRNGVDVYRIVYRTPDANGRRTTASGLLTLPRTPDRAVRVVSFTHGTISYRPDAPSSLPEDLYASAPSIAYAGAGFASVAPDYVGLGLGPDPHPYFDIPSETSASLDLLRAARSFVRTLGRQVDRGVLVTGFSQGASAALGLGRALQRHADPYFRLRALAPVSGAYDFRGAELPALLANRVAPPNGVAYTTYLFVAWSRRLHLDIREFVREPYATRAATLFNGNTPGADMIRALPATPGKLLTARGRAALAHPTGALAADVRTIDGVCRWRPDVPTRLYYARGDEQVVHGNVTSCAASLRERGVPVRTVDVGTRTYAQSRHLGSAIAGTSATLRWFRKLG